MARNVPGIPGGACTTLNFTYLVRGPYERQVYSTTSMMTKMIWWTWLFIGFMLGGWVVGLGGSGYRNGLVLTVFRQDDIADGNTCITRIDVSHDSWWRHQMEKFSALLAICAGNSPVPVNSPHKGQWRGALMFSLICARINDWVNNREAGDLRRHRGHYGISVMLHAWYVDVNVRCYIKVSD